MAEMPMSGARGCDQLAKRYEWRGATRNAASVGEVPHGSKLPRFRFQSDFQAGLFAQPAAVFPVRLETAQSDPVLPVG